MGRRSDGPGGCPSLPGVKDDGLVLPALSSSQTRDPPFAVRILSRPV